MPVLHNHQGQYPGKVFCGWSLYRLPMSRVRGGDERSSCTANAPSLTACLTPALLLDDDVGQVRPFVSVCLSVKSVSQSITQFFLSGGISERCSGAEQAHLQSATGAVNFRPGGHPIHLPTVCEQPPNTQYLQAAILRGRTCEKKRTYFCYCVGPPRLSICSISERPSRSSFGAGCALTMSSMHAVIECGTHHQTLLCLPGLQLHFHQRPEQDHHPPSSPALATDQLPSIRISCSHPPSNDWSQAQAAGCSLLAPPPRPLLLLPPTAMATRPLAFPCGYLLPNLIICRLRSETGAPG